MKILVFADTALLAVLTLLMVGLLRGHAELLRRTTSGSATRPRPEPEAAPVVKLPEPRAVETPAADVAGATVDGGAAVISMRSDRNTLLAFLSSGCSACVPFWAGLTEVRRQPLPGDARIVVVTKDPSFELMARLKELVPRGATVVMSSQAWTDYQVELSPYFIYVDGLVGEVRSEGAATTWNQVLSLLHDAIAEYELAGT
jgi:hypothetical protein